MGKFEVDGDGYGIFTIEITNHLMELMYKDKSLARIGPDLDNEAKWKAGKLGYEIVEVVGIKSWESMKNLVTVIEARYRLNRVPDRAAIGRAG